MGLVRRWACLLVPVSTLFASPINPMESLALAQEWNFAVGLKEQYFSLTRFYRINFDGKRFEAPQTVASWRWGINGHASYGRFFMGASYSSVSPGDTFFDISTVSPPASISVLRDSTKSGVLTDITEMEAALGISLFNGISPYFAYFAQDQKTGKSCAGCVSSVQIRGAGPGLKLDFPVSDSPWTVYSKAELVRGISLEGGLSYAGARWPLTGVFGYAYRRIDYSSTEASCSRDNFVCYRDHDIQSGPLVTVNFIF